MQLEGNHVLNAKRLDVWNILMDPQTLARIAPGIAKLEETGENTYDAIAEVKIGPVSGTFKGEMEIKDKEEPESFALSVKQKSKIGNVSALVAIKLRDLGEKCEVQFDGKVKLSGLLARTGQRVLSGVANTLTKQFFQALEQEIENQDS